MAETAGTLLSVLAARVRDPERSATPHDDMRLLLGWAQRCVNAKNGSVRVDEAFATTPARIVYTVSLSWPAAVRLTAVREGGRDLVRVPYRSLRQGNFAWFRQPGYQFLTWSMAGRDQLVLWPLRNDAVALTVQYVKLTALFTADSDLTEVPDAELDEVLALAETLVNLRTRAHDRVKEMLSA